MSFHRVVFVALVTLFTVGMTSMASACCGGWGYAAPGRLCRSHARRLWRLRQLRGADGGRGLFPAGRAGADCRQHLLRPRLGRHVVLGQWRRLLRRLWSTCCGSVSWNVGCGNCGAVGWCGGGWGGGWTPGRCNNCGVSPLYVVNQGPVYTGPGLMQPYATYPPDTA